MSVSAALAATPPSLDVTPAPQEVRRSEGRLPVTGELTVSLSGHTDARIEGALARLLRRWEERTGFVFPRTPSAQYVLRTAAATVATLAIDVRHPGGPLPTLGEDESYVLEITVDRVKLRSETAVGALHGLATLEQLLNADREGWHLPMVVIRDAPRFPWRGLLIDVCRHWQPMEVIKRNLDGMALVKLNVFHFHLTEDEGFRIESKTHPELHQQGSDGQFFTHEEIREIIAYAAERGIRVVPEFDVPGHCSSWLASHPELASTPGNYRVVHELLTAAPAMDPTNEQVYVLLDEFFGEMAALFPDPYIHIGGDEVNPEAWNASARIQTFIRERGLKDNQGLQAYFARRVRDLLRKHGKQVVGWEEIMRGEMPNDVIVQGWSGPEGQGQGHIASARQGYRTLLSNGYYIDLMHSAAKSYVVDPVPENSPLTPEQQKLMLGGEATMWTEWATPETIDSRIWPRTAAIAERLWSPREVRDVDAMYRRLQVVSLRLEEVGLHHERNRPAMIRRLAGSEATAAELHSLAAFVDLIEPVKEYTRGRQQGGYNQFRALTGLADCARPESDVARAFSRRVERWLARREATELADIRLQLAAWQTLGSDVAQFLTSKGIRDRASAPVAQSLNAISETALTALTAIEQGETRDASWLAAQTTLLDQREPGENAILLPIIPAVRQLVRAAAPAK